MDQMSIEQAFGTQAVLRAIRHQEYLASEKYQKQQWQAVRVGAHPDLLEFERRFVRRMEALGVPAFAHNMVRGCAEQDALRAKGVSKSACGRSPHNYGLAVDIVHGILAWGMLKQQWAIFGHVGFEVASQMGVKMTWGGHWSDPWDPAHWQLAEWKKMQTGFPFAERSVCR